MQADWPQNSSALSREMNEQSSRQFKMRRKQQRTADGYFLKWRESEQRAARLHLM